MAHVLNIVTPESRILDLRVVTKKMAAVGLKYVNFVGIGFGPFCFAGRKLFSERQSIRISRQLTRLFGFLSIQRPLPWLMDVSLWVYQKPVGP